MADVDLNFLARQLERLTAEVRGIRDDIHVLSAITDRLDHTMAAGLEELRAVNEWVRRMEGQP